jgi:cell wall-associated NlpC family hydrolase
MLNLRAYSQTDTVQRPKQHSLEDILTEEITTAISNSSNVEETDEDANITPLSIAGLTVSIDSLIAFGKTFLGRPYHSRIENGNFSYIMDCSGYVGMLFQTFGVKLPRSSAEIATVTKKVPIKNAQPGDLIFFKGHNANQSRVGHVALVIENNDGVIQMIHSSCGKGITIDTYPDTYYYTRRFVKVGRLSQQ